MQQLFSGMLYQSLRIDYTAADDRHIKQKTAFAAVYYLFGGRQAEYLYIRPPLAATIQTQLGGGYRPLHPHLNAECSARKGVIFIANKSKMFCFRISEKDFLSIQNKAEKAKLNLTAYITTTALQKQIVVIDGLDKTISELKAIGRNLNQLTILCNMGKIKSVELVKIKERFGAVLETILALNEG